MSKPITYNLQHLVKDVATNNRKKAKKRPQTICLNMIVKNEEHVIKEVLECMSKYIDYYVICDTGSTDKTEKTITAFMEEKQIPGEIHHHEWKNFGHNRTLALKAAVGKGDYLWIIDADDLVEGNLVLPSPMTADGYNLKFGNTFVYDRTQIVRNDTGNGPPRYGWNYFGVLHEYIAPTTKLQPKFERIEGDYFMNSRRLGNRNLVNDKYLRDAKVFEKELAENPFGPLSTRYYFYLAQSYRDAKIPEKAIENYWKRVERGGWAEEVYYSLLQIASLMLGAKNPATLSKEETAEIVRVYMKAVQKMAGRAEALFEIAKLYTAQGNNEMAYHFLKKAAAIAYPVNDKLFVDAPIYQFRAYDDLLICAYALGKFDEAAEIADKLATECTILPNSQERIKHNIEIARSHLGANQGSMKRFGAADGQQQSIKIFEPSDKKVLCIYAGYSSIVAENNNNLHPMDAAEMELKYLAEQLAATGRYDIFIFQNVSEIVLRNGVKYLHINMLEEMMKQSRFVIDIMLVFRYINYFIHCGVKAKRVYLLAHDNVFNSYYNGVELAANGRHLLRNVMSLIDGVIGLSEWHTNNLKQAYDVPAEKMITLPYIRRFSLATKRMTNTASAVNVASFAFASGNVEALKKFLQLAELIAKRASAGTTFKIYTSKQLLGEVKFGEMPIIDYMNSKPYIEYNGALLEHEIIERLPGHYYLYPGTGPDGYVQILACAGANCICPDVGPNKEYAPALLYNVGESDEVVADKIVEFVGTAPASVNANASANALANANAWLDKWMALL